MDLATPDELLRRIQHQSRPGGIDKALDESNIVVILRAADSEANVYTCCSRCPSVALPWVHGDSLRGSDFRQEWSRFFGSGAWSCCWRSPIICRFGIFVL